MKQNTQPNKSGITKWLSIFFMLLAVAYLIMPVDFDGTIIGYVDDFFVFMAAFCFAFTQFSHKMNTIIRRQLYTFSIVFLILAILWILILTYTPFLQLVA